MNKLQKVILCIILASLFLSGKSFAQDKYMRIANINVDSVSLEKYKVILNEQMTSALLLEPGVLAYSAFYDKNDPSRITIFETYASVAAYESHIKTAHFLKYKTAVANMVKSLELIDVVPISIKQK